MKHKILILLLFLLPIFYGCNNNNNNDVKRFLFDHPEITFQINSKGTIYNKYTSNVIFKRIKCKNEIVVFFINDKKYEVLLSSNFQKIGETNYYVKDS